MNLGLTGRVALVGGSSAGLGRAVAEALVGEGCDVMLCARTPESLERTRTEIASKTDRRVEAVAADLGTEAGCQTVLAAAQAAFGRVDILVTNTGGPPAGSFDAHSHEAWQRASTLLLESVLHLVRGVLPGMRERKWGRILTITSIAVKQPADGLILSNSLRAAVAGFARSLANEVAVEGITVNNLMPGFTRTERSVQLAEHQSRTRGISTEEVLADWEAAIPARRLGEPEELAALAAFLASEKGAYITAQSIAVDGGWIRSLL